MRKRSIGPIAVSLAAAMVLAACGSDEELSKAEYIAKGDALCKAIDEEGDPTFDKIFAEFPDVDMAVAKSELPKVAEATEKFVADFTDLEGPEADAAVIEKINARVKKLGTTISTAAEHAKAGDEEKFKETFFENFDEFEALDKASRDYGFKVCGEEDEDEDEDEGKGKGKGPATPLTPEQQAFVDQGDAVCKAADEIVEPKLGPVFSAKLPEAATALKVILPSQRDQVAKLRALTPPPGDEAKVKELIDSLDAVNPAIEKLLAAAEAGDKTAYNAAFKDVNRGFEATEEPFEEYGFEECGG
ncbi:MAG TPA: hypothetical protein VMZ51_03805 [Acidimicrobiales bacterium]|nr:hypothetical protein [Acidimicrobiales bacterium]